MNYFTYMLRTPSKILSYFIHVNINVLTIDDRCSRRRRNETRQNRPEQEICPWHVDFQTYIVVVFPAPLCPRKERISPSYKSNDKFCTANFFLSKILVKFIKRIPITCAFEYSSCSI